MNGGLALGILGALGGAVVFLASALRIARAIFRWAAAIEELSRGLAQVVKLAAGHESRISRIEGHLGLPTPLSQEGLTE